MPAFVNPRIGPPTFLLYLDAPIEKDFFIQSQGFPLIACPPLLVQNPCLVVPRLHFSPPSVEAISVTIAVSRV